VPAPLANVFGLYTQWLGSLRPRPGEPTLFTLTWRITLAIGVNLVVVSAIFLGVSWSAHYAQPWFARWLSGEHAESIGRVALWGAALLLSMPFLIAVWHKMKALAMLLADVNVQPAKAGRLNLAMRHLIAQLLPIVAMTGVFLLVAALSSAILPPDGLLIIVLVCAAVLALLLQRWCRRIHASLQITLRDTFDKKIQTKTQKDQKAQKD